MQRVKILTFLAAMLIAAVALTACGGGQPATPAKDSKPAAEPAKEAAKAEQPKEQKEKFPNKALNLIIPFAPGGGTDVAGRIIAKTTEKHLGQSIQITNIEGGSSATGLVKLNTSKNDGYTIGLTTSSIYTLKPQGRMPYSSTDFEPIIGFNANYYTIAVPANSKFKTWEDLLDFTKKNPGKLNLGISAIGSNLHLAAVALEIKAGVKFNMIPDPGGVIKAVLETAGGNLDAGLGGPNEYQTHVKSGKIRLLAMMAPQRLPEFPDVPTFKEKGIDLEFTSERFILAPKGTAQDIVDFLHGAFKKGMAEKEYDDYVKKSGSNEFYISNKDGKKYMQQKDELYLELLKKADLLKKEK